ncbi:MAG TPA: heparinase II/III family protein [Gemmatimonadales bacterium]|nr:heparinase II/III family protein [Gemmatimonadales bacterium]
MLTASDLDLRRELLGHAPDLSALALRLAERAAPFMRGTAVRPEQKALLSRDGGRCPDDGASLVFDPWSPRDHRCPRCGRTFRGERHDRAWARYQHLWLAERAATLAALASLAGHAGAAERAGGILSDYASSYFLYLNRDNVLGPSRLFFSTYLESIWITNYLAAATMLRESGALSSDVADGVGVVAEEAANIIGEFDEGFSNRQTWHNAALAAIAVWFEDEELLTRAVQGPTGMLAHLVQGFGEDGMWYEGENYHLFALRGQLTAMGWARQAGVDLLEDERLVDRLYRALRAPTVTALPDLTFPARKDSRFGLSLAQPMYLELWEIGLARLGEAGADLGNWLRQLYAVPAPRAETFDSYLHEADAEAPGASRTRADLSWWALAEMAPALPGDGSPWSPGSALMERQGLAILREGNRYVSLECGPFGGGHGHPDRLHLTVHADGRHWLADPGTGSYVSRDLFWYRSTLAHNAPRLDGRSQPAGDALCDAFDVQGPEEARWAWTRGRYGSLTRTLVAGSYLIDLVELGGTTPGTLELPWHIEGQVEVITPGSWTAAHLDDPFVENVERFTGSVGAGVVLRARSDDGAALSLHLHFDGELLRASVPGRPDRGGRMLSYLVRTRNGRIAAALESTRGAPLLRSLRVAGEVLEVETASGVDRHRPTAAGWEVTTATGAIQLGGSRRPGTAAKPLIDMDKPVRAAGVAVHIAAPPAVDGSLDDFDATEPLTLDYDDQYRRSEEPYGGPEELSATVLANWDTDALYLGVDVVKADVVVRPDDAPPLALDNEPDDIHADGLQIYFRPEPDGPVYGFLVALSDENGAIRVTGASGTAGAPALVEGRWSSTGTGYAITLRVVLPEWSPRGGDLLGFDLLVNEMHPGRLRRAGQLVWSGGGGWVYLRGDRQPPESFGRLELR